MKTLVVFFNHDGHIRNLERHITDAMTDLAIEHEVCYIEEFPKKSREYEPILTLFFHPNKLIYNYKSAIEKLKGHKLLWDMESPYESDIVFDMLPLIHYMFISDEATVDMLKKDNPTNEIFYVPHACDPKIHKPIEPEEIPYEYKSDFVLIGNAYESRIKWLQENREMFKGNLLTVIGVGYWGLEGFHNQRFIRHHVSEEECVKYYNGAKTVLNLHRINTDLDMANERGIAPKHLNNRFYEVAAMGRPQIIEGRGTMTEEAKRINTLKPEEYSYTARLKEFFVPLLK